MKSITHSIITECSSPLDANGMVGVAATLFYMTENASREEMLASEIILSHLLLKEERRGREYLNSMATCPFFLIDFLDVAAALEVDTISFLLVLTTITCAAPIGKNNNKGQVLQELEICRNSSSSLRAGSVIVSYVIDRVFATFTLKLATVNTSSPLCFKETSKRAS